MVIWDLDDTLWHGSVYYKDKEVVKLKDGSKEVLKELNKRGIKNVVCSKNYFSIGALTHKQRELIKIKISLDKSRNQKLSGLKLRMD